MTNFGTHLAIEHLKTDYPIFLIAALQGKGTDLTVKVFSSIEEDSTSKQVINSELAKKLITHLNQYV